MYNFTLMMTPQQKEKLVDLLKLYKCFGIEYMEPLRLSKGDIKLNSMLPDSHKQLYEYIEHCNLCELSKGCEKKIGLNDPNASVYIVGINDDFNDYNTAELLKLFFQSILQVDFNKVYMTNIIKCETKRQGFNYNEAALKCQEYIFQEIIIGKPKYIFATVSACKYLLKNQLVDNSFVGNSYEVNETVVFPIFDFEFISKNPSYKQEMERVFKRIKGSIS